MKKLSGIYKITNKINNKCYIGQSLDIYLRWKDHERFAKSKIYDYPIYRAIERYGIENFTFEVLEITEPNKDIMNIKEMEYIEQYNSYLNGYNATVGGGSTANKYNNITKEDIINIRTRKMKVESPTLVYKDYEDKISFGNFDKIWNGYYYSEIMPEIYNDRDKLKEIESILKRGENKFSAKLIEAEVIDIRKRRKNKEKRKDVYLLYKDKISIYGFDGVWYNKKWKYIIV